MLGLLQSVDLKQFWNKGLEAFQGTSNPALAQVLNTATINVLWNNLCPVRNWSLIRPKLKSETFLLEPICFLPVSSSPEITIYSSYESTESQCSGIFTNIKVEL
jgi:hypothetical protein